MTSGSVVVGSGQLGDRGTIEPAQLHDDGRRRREAPDDGIGQLVEVLRTPGQQHEDRAAREARRQVVERFEGRAIGPLAGHRARCSPAPGRRSAPSGRPRWRPRAERARPGRRRGSRRGRPPGRDGGQQAGQLRTDARVTETLHGARFGDGRSQQLHDRAVGDGPLADVGARGEDRAASRADRVRRRPRRAGSCRCRPRR